MTQIRYNHTNHVFVVVIPGEDGAELPVSEHGDGRFWCGGIIRSTIEECAAFFHEHWNDVPIAWDDTYARQERAFTERFES